MKLLLTSFLCLFFFTTHAQESGTTETETSSESEGYEAKMIKTSRMKMEYMDFGGTGKTLINIQGVHNASALKNDNNYHQNYVQWRDILTKASLHYRVYSPIYRGRGNSDKDGDDIFNVENIALDILAFMDELNIESATFIGRTNSPQVMLYLAENYPKRVDAMVANGVSMYKTVPIKNDEIKEFFYYSSYAATDLGDLAPNIVMPIYNYEPNFYNDETRKIDIPLYWPYTDQMNIGQMEASLINYLQPDNTFIPIEKVKTYFNNLYNDKERQERIKFYCMENDPTKKNMDALKNAFGENLILENIDEIDAPDMMKKFEMADEILKEYLISISTND